MSNKHQFYLKNNNQCENKADNECCRCVIPSYLTLTNFGLRKNNSDNGLLIFSEMNAFLGKQNKAFCVRGLVIVCVFSINSLNFARAENIIPIPSTDIILENIEPPHYLYGWDRSISPIYNSSTPADMKVVGDRVELNQVSVITFQPFQKLNLEIAAGKELYLNNSLVQNRNSCSFCYGFQAHDGSNLFIRGNGFLKVSERGKIDGEIFNVNGSLGSAFYADDNSSINIEDISLTIVEAKDAVRVDNGAKFTITNDSFIYVTQDSSNPESEMKRGFIIYNTGEINVETKNLIIENNSRFPTQMSFLSTADRKLGGGLRRDPYFPDGKSTITIKSDSVKLKSCDYGERLSALRDDYAFWAYAGENGNALFDLSGYAIAIDTAWSGLYADGDLGKQSQIALNFEKLIDVRASGKAVLLAASEGSSKAIQYLNSNTEITLNYNTDTNNSFRNQSTIISQGNGALISVAAPLVTIEGGRIKNSISASDHGLVYINHADEADTRVNGNVLAESFGRISIGLHKDLSYLKGYACDFSAYDLINDGLEDIGSITLTGSGNAVWEVQPFDEAEKQWSSVNILRAQGYSTDQSFFRIDLIKNISGKHQNLLVNNASGDDLSCLKFILRFGTKTESVSNAKNTAIQGIEIEFGDQVHIRNGEGVHAIFVDYDGDGKTQKKVMENYLVRVENSNDMTFTLANPDERVAMGIWYYVLDHRETPSTLAADGSATD